MANCLFAYPDRTLSGAVTGGNWTGLDRLLDSSRYARANSNALDLGSTQFTVDLQEAKDVRFLGLLDHNASLNAQIRVRVGNDLSFADNLFDSGWSPFWFTFFPQGGLPWGHPSLWDGGQCSDEDYSAFPKCRFFQLTDDWAIQARYALVEIDDQANPAGFVSLSRCFFAPAWQPPINMAYNAQMGWDDSATIVSTSKGGIDFFGVNPKRRICSFTLESTEAVGVSWLMELQRKLGKSGEFFFVFDPDDATMLEQTRSFLATMKDLSPLEYPFFDRNTCGFQLREKL